MSRIVHKAVPFVFAMTLLPAGWAAAGAGTPGDGDPAPVRVEEGAFPFIDLDRERVLGFRAGSWTFHAGGRIFAGGYRYGASNLRDNTFTVSDGRLYVEGEQGAFRLHLEPDLVGVDTPRNLYEAWVEGRVSNALHLRVGQVRMALASAFGTREENFPLPGYGFTSYLDGRYDNAVQAWGNLGRGILYWEGTASAGTGFGLEGHRRENPRYSLRLVCHPFAEWGPDRPEWKNYLHGFFLGAAAAWSPEYDEPLVVATPLESVVMRTGDLGGRSARWLHLESGWAVGPVLVGADDLLVGEVKDVPAGPGNREDLDRLFGWSVYAAWNVTGEKTAWRNGGWAPARAKGSSRPPGAGLFRGRVEVAARYANADLDRKLFQYGYADHAEDTQEVRTFTLALNWYPVEHTRLTAGWVKTLADEHLAAFGGTTRDSAFLLGLELVF